MALESVLERKANVQARLNFEVLPGNHTTTFSLAPRPESF